MDILTPMLTDAMRIRDDETEKNAEEDEDDDIDGDSDERVRLFCFVFGGGGRRPTKSCEHKKLQKSTIVTSKKVLTLFYSIKFRYSHACNDDVFDYKHIDQSFSFSFRHRTEFEVANPNLSILRSTVTYEAVT